MTIKVIYFFVVNNEDKVTPIKYHKIRAIPQMKFERNPKYPKAPKDPSMAGTRK